MNVNNKKIFELNKQVISSLVPLIKGDYVLLDIPSHANIGDHLIYEGELVFLKKYVQNYQNIHTSDCHNFDYRKVKKDSIILLHGGGNFGDIYDLHQNFRLEIIKNFPDNRIVVFPQTVFYKNPDKLKKDCDVFNQHADLHICVRDMLSYNLLTQYMAKEKILLLPDMAFFIDFSKYQKKNKEKKVLLMYRVDIESTGSPDSNLLDKLYNEKSNFDIKDWPTYYDTFDIKLYNLYNRFRSKFFKKLSRYSILDKCKFSSINDLMLKDHYIKMGIKFMNQYDVVYTTRLHGLILAILLDKDIIALDNNYGKLSSFYNTWLKDFENVAIQSNNESIC